jgi:hypothetical protein
MSLISSALSGELVWSKTPCRGGYELKRNDEIVGSLQRTSFWSSEFRAKSAHGSWRFRRTGCFRTGMEIVNSNYGTRIAILKPNWSSGGTLAFSDGLTFRLISRGFWWPVWTVLADSGQPVLRIHSREKTVVLATEPVSEDKLILLGDFRVAHYAASRGGCCLGGSGGRGNIVRT